MFTFTQSSRDRCFMPLGFWLLRNYCLLKLQHRCRCSYHCRLQDRAACTALRLWVNLKQFSIELCLIPVLARVSTILYFRSSILWLSLYHGLFRNALQNCSYVSLNCVAGSCERRCSTFLWKCSSQFTGCTRKQLVLYLQPTSLPEHPRCISLLYCNTSLVHVSNVNSTETPYSYI